MSSLYVPVLVVHALVAVLGLGSIASVAVVAATARRAGHSSRDVSAWLGPLLRYSGFSLAAMLVTGVLLDFAAGGVFHEAWWFRGSALLLVATGVLHAQARRAIRPGLTIDAHADVALQRVERIAYGMCALIATVTVTWRTSLATSRERSITRIGTSIAPLIHGRRAMTLQFVIRTVFRSVTGAVFVSLIASPLAAQSNQGRFQGMDQNGDGIISRAEWRGSDQSFRRHDWNNDGVLSGDEVWAGGRRGWPRGGDNDFGSGREPEISDWTAENFARLDRNRDDRISEQEWYYDWEAFRRIDRNRDGVVSRREFLGNDAADDDDREDRFDAIDVDQNGQVTDREWHGSRETFKWLDRNGDGVLTRAEVVGEPQPARNLFDHLDLDRNGRITLNEWQWSKASFDRRDSDGNGSLDRTELTSVAQPHTNAYEKGVERGLIDGRQAGREDKTRRNRWDLDGQRELEQADAGYTPNMGARSEYQSGYRDGFTKGYREGFGPR